MQPLAAGKLLWYKLLVPTYEYRCADCGHTFEVKQSFDDEALTVCPECGGELRKQFGSLGVTFKGSGFYRTDSAKKPAAPSKPAKPSK